MELSKFTVGIIFIFLPGILALIISERLTEHGERKGYELFAYALVLGCAAHVLYALIQTAFPSLNLDDDLWLTLMLDEEAGIQSSVVLYSAGLGLCLGFALAFVANHSWLHWIAAKLHVSRKFSELDVWAHLMARRGIDWVVIRDQAKNLMYQGRVLVFSIKEDPRELLLSNATVFTNDSGTRLYDVETLYLSFEKKAVTLEIFGKETNGQNH
jgi:Family of unknown function (DUF6338)